ncbi:40S ribosomal protein S10 [Tupaia chinensis]|uniref:40S ribosomal protein S10 n=1 Tax=Tupaia chinensis TaxID=246437 RepID=L9KPN4_TUPCH|nr:40S ribosomal protein S10 [Tupaia chinensis]
MRVSSTCGITFICPCEIMPATLCGSRPETGRPQPKGLEGERPARLTRGEADRDTYRHSAMPPGADRKAEARALSATKFQFRADLVVYMANHLSKVGGDYVVLNKLVARKKIKQEESVMI